ncbi:MAG TPA: helix-turn-helix transcriptional regulator [Bryobacteraceae bacterium]|nr:helix-turn-helix transcriptional regulator [Bryobacteraceae bacterium]
MFPCVSPERNVVTGSARKRGLELDALLDLWPLGVVVLNFDGEVLATNKAGRQVMEHSEVFVLQDRRLSTNSVPHSRLMKAAITSLGSGQTHAPVAFSISRAQRHPVSVAMVGNLVKLRKTAHSDHEWITMFVNDPDLAPPPDLEIIGKLFDFTPAEAVIAGALMQIRNTSLADSVNLSAHTVRNHLKRMFSKTNTHNQCELLNLLLRTPVNLLWDRGRAQINPNGAQGRS